MKIEYDGTDFCGWQRQPNVRTVQGELEAALTRIAGRPMTIDGVSRTDAGVHALGQCATFQWDCGIPVERLAKVINDKFSHLMKDGDVRVLEAREVPAGFHARFDSRGKKYRYQISNGANCPVFQRNYSYHVREELDVEAMREAAGYIVGTHDFACFQAAGGTPRETTVRTIYSLDVMANRLPGGTEIALEVSGDGFLYNMVRIITGTLVDVGRGRIPAARIPEIIESKDRTLAGHTAPPQGLYLVEVYYEEGE